MNEKWKLKTIPPELTWKAVEITSDNCWKLFQFDHLAAQKGIDDLKVNYSEVDEHATHSCGFYQHP